VRELIQGLRQASGQLRIGGFEQRWGLRYKKPLLDPRVDGRVVVSMMRVVGNKPKRLLRSRPVKRAVCPVDIIPASNHTV